jgi:hypothetical protein
MKGYERNKMRQTIGAAKQKSMSKQAMRLNLGRSSTFKTIGYYRTDLAQLHKTGQQASRAEADEIKRFKTDST